MSLLDRITSAVSTAAATIGTAWHDHIAPWLGDFLKNTAHDVMEGLKPIAEQEVAQIIPSLVTAIKNGDTDGYADAQWDAFTATAKKALGVVVNATLTDAQTAVTALIAGHPEVVTANAEKTAAAAQPQATETATEEPATEQPAAEPAGA